MMQAADFGNRNNIADRHAVMETLVSKGDRGTRLLLTALRGPNARAQDAAVQGLTKRLDKERISTILKTFGESRDIEVLAVKILCGIVDKDMVAQLLELAKSKPGRPRTLAISQLARMGKLGAEALATALLTSDIMLMKAAMEGLRRMGPTAADQLLSLLDDPNADVRGAVSC